MKHKISIRTKNDILSLEDFKERSLTNESVIGIILQTEVRGIIISKYQWEEVWSNNKGLRVFEKRASEVEALQILNGLESTKRIVDQQQEAGESMTAAIKCWYYDEGSLQWYLPSLYELATIIAYRDEINDVLDALGLEPIRAMDYGWTSSENGDNAYYVNFGNGYCRYNLKGIKYMVRAVAEFGSLMARDEVEEEAIHQPEEEAISFLKGLGYTGELTKRIRI